MANKKTTKAKGAKTKKTEAINVQLVEGETGKNFSERWKQRLPKEALKVTEIGDHSQEEIDSFQVDPIITPAEQEIVDQDATVDTVEPPVSNDTTKRN